MPTIERTPEPLERVPADAVALFVTCAGEDAERRPVVAGQAAAAAGLLGVDIGAELAAVRFQGTVGSVARVPTRGAMQAPVLLIVGVGPAADLTLEGLRRAAGLAARNAPKDAVLALAVPTGLLSSAAVGERARAVAEGAGLGAYAYTAYRAKPHDLPTVERVLLIADEQEAPDAVVNAAAVVVRATCLARDLVNTPPADKRPPALAARMEEIARAAGLEVVVHDEEALREGGFGGILGVGQGSSAPPRLVELRYTPAGGDGGADGHVALIGKGITFDSGGLSLKPSESMVTMKSDMSGAAAVIATMSALAELGVSVPVRGYAALAENLPSGTAIRVSDVLRHRGGKTVEVMNTDAEGRLVLADAIVYASESSPAAIIDLATLTGAQVVALGNRVSAILGTDDALIAELRAAADEAGEQVWPLPLHREYADQLRSEVADLKNIGKRGQAGTILAALFLAEFAGKVPWAHLDIAGPAFADEADTGYTHAGGTGAGVRLLLRYLLARSSAA